MDGGLQKLGSRGFLHLVGSWTQEENKSMRDVVRTYKPPNNKIRRMGHR